MGTGVAILRTRFTRWPYESHSWASQGSPANCMGWPSAPPDILRATDAPAVEQSLAETILLGSECLSHYVCKVYFEQARAMVRMAVTGDLSPGKLSDRRFRPVDSDFADFSECSIQHSILRVIKLLRLLEVGRSSCGRRMLATPSGNLARTVALAAWCG